MRSERPKCTETWMDSEAAILPLWCWNWKIVVTTNWPRLELNEFGVWSSKNTRHPNSLQASRSLWTSKIAAKKYTFCRHSIVGNVADFICIRVVGVGPLTKAWIFPITLRVNRRSSLGVFGENGCSKNSGLNMKGPINSTKGDSNRSMGRLDATHTLLFLHCHMV